MLDKSKTNSNLGNDIHRHLFDLGVETPMIKKINNPLEKISNITGLFQNIMTELNLDLKDDSLGGTPERIAKMYVNEIFWGLDYNNFPKIIPFENKMKYDEMIIEKNITVKSMCEHHFVTFYGYAHIGYIPNGYVLGLSKLNRVVEFFSRRPQIQERLTEQIFHTLHYILNTDNIGVLISAKHLCVVQRGVEDESSTMITSKLGGSFRDNEVRAEFLNLIR